MQWEKNGMNLCPKNGVINCIHTHKISILDVKFFFNRNFSCFNNENCGEKFLNSFICRCCCAITSAYVCATFLDENNFCSPSIALCEQTPSEAHSLTHTFSSYSAASTLWFLSFSREEVKYFSLKCLALPQRVISVSIWTLS